MIYEITRLFKHIQDGVNGEDVKFHVELELNKDLDNVKVWDNVQVQVQKHRIALPLLVQVSN